MRPYRIHHEPPIGGRRLTYQGRQYCHRNVEAAVRLRDRGHLMTSSGENPPPQPVGMNQYARTAQRFWAENRPGELGQITNPGEFFSALGQQIAQRVTELTPELMSPTSSGEDYLARVGRENAARSQAEEIALNDLVFALGPEEDPEEATDEAGKAALEMHLALMEAKSEADQNDQ